MKSSEIILIFFKLLKQRQVSKKMNERNTMTVKEAAKILEVGTQKIRTGIISGKLPIGTAIFEEERGCYSYIIPRKRFDAWLSGEDLKPIISLLAN